jgi:uncharacterized protein YecE (DUF72 family)
MKTKINIGTSGFRSNKLEYARLLSCVEIQDTFYQPPQIKTLERWREAVPAEFEFVLKAWQLITHEAKSPTYKRLKKKLSETEKAETGYFKPTTVVAEAWQTIQACAAALRARMILFQCPASFVQTTENVSNLERFFSNIDRGALQFAWEPRGDWNNKIVKSICEDLRLWHAVDPFAAKTATPNKCYFRLHGRTGWRYKYEESELEELATIMPETESYVFFNNIYMTEDALKFQEIAGENNRELYV